MVWEPSVTEGFAEAFYQGKTVPQYFLDCLAWNNGLVSNGHLTLLYGVLTYGLWAVRGVSPLTLRLIAAILARISNQLPTTVGDAPHPAVFSRLWVLDVLSSTTPRPSGRKPHWARHLAVLVT